MTEKRFKVEKQILDGYCIIDNNIDGYYTYDKQDLEKLCKSLNDLSNENKQLKLICKDHRNHANDFKVDCIRLEEENKQLKKENKTLFTLSNMRRGTLVKMVNKLSKENKQLEEEIKDLNDILTRYEEKGLKE